VNQFRTVETADLRTAIEESTGQGLNWFFDQWIHHGGHPDFHVSWHWDETAKSVVLTVKQTQKVDDLTPLFRLPVEIEIASGTAAEMKRITVSKAEETFHFAMPARPTRVSFDPRDWLLKTLVCDKSKEEWLDQLANSEHVIARAQAVAGLAAYKDHQDTVQALIVAARRDPFWGVRLEAVKQLGTLNKDDVRAALVQAAQQDEKSFVRREAVQALGKFAGDEVKQTLRRTIAQDKSYETVADALRALVKVDRENCRADLLAALDQSSQNAVILKAATDGLIELRETSAVDPLKQKLAGKLRPDERVVAISALARLKPDDAALMDQLKAELDNDRRNVRRTAMEALVSIGAPDSIAWLQARRAKEENPGAVRAIDEALEKLRSAQKPLVDVQKEVDRLRDENRKLEERLKKLEGK
jgi:aminopeptidase N